MNKKSVIPRLAINGIFKNKTTYSPYLFANIICVSVFYIFVSIQNNPIMETLPHASYVAVLMIIGEVLLAIILAPFLISVNNYLIKRRKKELGLYCVLGLEKKHIGLMMGIESLIIYVMSLAGGIIIAAVFSKLIFMLLLKITHISGSISFIFSGKALAATIIYFGIISAVNLAVNIFRVSLANPSELFRASKSGEKEPKHLLLSALAGTILLGGGYYIALKSKMSMYIFTDFLLAVAMVVLGTHLLFQSGSIAFLRACRLNKKYYYKSRNFVTVSGMIYRMKKNATGLTNICIFCTMTIITLTCTGAVFFGQNSATEFSYPYDYSFYFNADSFTKADEFDSYVNSIAKESNTEIKDTVTYTYNKLTTYISGENWLDKPAEPNQNEDIIRALSLEDYNRTQKENVTLAENEILIYSTSKDYKHSSVIMNGKTFTVKEELQELSFDNKNIRNFGEMRIYAVFANNQIIDSLKEKYTKDIYAPNNTIYVVRFNVTGGDAKQFSEKITSTSESLEGFNQIEDKTIWAGEAFAINGGLMFLGIFFGIIFTVCMVLIMYYKQISEGYEDKMNFEIMQNVGMTDKEVRSTISRQILTVFILPITTAMIHTAVSVNIVSNLMATIKIFSIPMIVACSACTTAIFAIVYAISYVLTAKAYYRIIK